MRTALRKSVLVVIISFILLFAVYFLLLKQERTSIEQLSGQTQHIELKEKENVIPGEQSSTTLQKEETVTRKIPPTVFVLEVDSVHSVNLPAVTKEYFKKYQDTNDFLAIFTYGGDKSQYHLTIKNDTKGISDPNVTRVIDTSERYGSEGTLLGLGVIGDIKQYPSDRPIYNALLEEIFAHYWGIYVGDVIDNENQHPLPLQNTLTRSHWTSCLNFLDRPTTTHYWKANNWKKIDQNTWEFVYPTENLPHFDPLLLYFMGYLEASKVPDVELIIPDAKEKALYCNQNETIKGQSRIISINEIINNVGPREPRINPKKDYSVGYILLVNRGTVPDASSVEVIERVAAQLPQVFRNAITR